MRHSETMVPVLTALIGAFATVAVAVVGKLDWSKGNPIPNVGGCKQVTTTQLKKVDDSIDAIQKNIGLQQGINEENRVSFLITIQAAKVAVAEIRGAC
jgi:hypothetical protein